MHVVKAMVVFGFGNFIGTTLSSIQFFDNFPTKYFPVVNVICFIAMYIVNFFFTMRNYDHSMIVLDRNVYKNLVLNEMTCKWIETLIYLIYLDGNTIFINFIRLLFPEDIKNLFYILGFSTIAVNYLPKYLSLYSKTAKVE